MKRLGKLLLALACLGVLANHPGTAGAAAPPLWKTDAAFQRALTARFGVVNWPEGSRLSDQLQRLAEWQRVAIFLDRRIDPSTPIELTVRQVTLAELLEQLATQSGAVTAHIGSVVYIGPRDTIAGLPLIAQQRAREVRALPGNSGRPLLASRRWGWDELAEPRALLAELAGEAGVVIEGIDEIPHDLWPKTDLPSLSWSDRLSIVLAGFGRTFELAERGNTVRIVPMPEQTLVTRSYSTALSQMNFDRIARQFSGAEVERSRDGITLKGTVEQHDRLRRLLTRAGATKRTRGAPPETVHSLRVTQQPIGAILKTLEQQLQLRVEYGAGVAEKLQTRVTFDLRDVSLDKLLEATLAPASLTARREGDMIHIEIGK